MTRFNQLLSLCFTFLAACATSAPDHDGLSLDASEPDHVAGSFTRDGITLRFDLSRADDRHTFVFRAADGAELIATTLVGAQQTMTVLGGRLTVSGIANAPNPQIEGDRDAMAGLEARPEAALLEDLRDALVAAGVESALFAPEPPKAVSDIYSDGHYYYFQPDESKDWLSAAGAWPTYIYANSFAPSYPQNCTAVALYPWSSASADWMIVDPYTTTYKTKYWWGAAFTVQNTGAWTSWGGKVCAPQLIAIRVSPYSWSP